MTVEARGEGEGHVVMRVCQAKPPHKHQGGTRNVALSENWQRHVLVFNGRDVTPDNPPGLRIVLAPFSGRVFIRNVSLQEIEPRKIISKTGWPKSFALDEKIVIKPSLATSTSTAQTPAKASSATTSASALAATFSRDAAGAKAAYGNTLLRVRGGLTNIEPALAGDTLLELDGGQVSILVPSGEISQDQDRFVKSALATAKQQARKGAYPVAELTGTIVGFRKGSVKMRHGKNVKFEKGD